MTQTQIKTPVSPSTAPATKNPPPSGDEYELVRILVIGSPGGVDSIQPRMTATVFEPPTPNGDADRSFDISNNLGEFSHDRSIN